MKNRTLANRIISLLCALAVLLSSAPGLAESLESAEQTPSSGGSAVFGVAVTSNKDVAFNYEDEGDYADVSITGTHRKNNKPTVQHLGARSSLVEAWTINNLKNNASLSLTATVTALPDDGTALAAYAMKGTELGDKLRDNLAIGDEITVDLAFKGTTGIGFVKGDEPVLTDGAVIWANDDVYLTGKMPGNAVVEATPVLLGAQTAQPLNVNTGKNINKAPAKAQSAATAFEIDGRDVLAAYDIKIYANANQQEKGKTWQPAGDKVQVHFFDDAFADAKSLSIYHMETENDEPVLVEDGLTSDDGWVSFEAESFSVYVVAGVIEKDIEIEGGTYRVSVAYDSEAGIPDGAELAVREVSAEDYLDRAAEALGLSEDDEVGYHKFLDIAIVKDGEEIEPKTPVEVTVRLLDVDGETAESLQVVHFGENGVEALNCTADEDGNVTFTTDSFSTFGFESILSNLLQWADDAVKFTLKGFSSLLGITYKKESIVVEQLERGLEIVSAYHVTSSRLLSGLRNLKLNINLLLDLGKGETVQVYAVSDGKAVGEPVEETDETALSISLDGMDSFAIVRDTGYREKHFDLDDVVLDGFVPKAAEATATDASNAPAVEALAGENSTTLAAYDITIMNGSEAFQPDEEHTVEVSIAVPETVEDASTLTVWHIADDGTAEKVEGFELVDGRVVFEAVGFSIYAVTDVNAKPRIFYTFHKGSETVATEYLTTIGEFYDPGVTVDYGQTFLGWAFDPAETDESKMYTWDQLKTKLADYWENGDPAILPGETEAWKDGEEIDVYARFKEAYYLRYMVMDTDGTVGILKSDSVRIDAADKTKTVDCEYNVTGEEFEGWIDSATGTVYENGDPLTLDHHIDLYAKLEGRYWLVFNANGTGATFTGPQLIYGNEVTTRPDDPTRKGYTFKGWNTEPDGSGDWWYNADTSVNRFGDSISQDTNLYAIWEGAPNSYTVLYWKQRATDEVGIENEDKKYDLVGSETVDTNVKTGDVITEAGLPSGWNNKTGTDYNQTHYSWNDLAADTTVAADGSTIVNVYYDRDIFSLFFEVNNNGSGPMYNRNDNSGTYAYVNGHMVEITVEDGVAKVPVYGTQYNASDREDEVMYGLVGGEYVQLTREPVYGYTYSYKRYDETTNNDGTQYALVDGEYIPLSYQVVDTMTTWDVQYRYNSTTSNGGTQYGIYNNEFVQLYRSYGTWYRQGSYYPYEGTRYTRTNGGSYSGTRYTTPDCDTVATGNTGTQYGRSGNTIYQLSPSVTSIYAWTLDGTEYTGTRYRLTNTDVQYTEQRYTKSGTTYSQTTENASSGQWGVDSRGGHVALSGTLQQTGYKYTYNGNDYTNQRFLPEEVIIGYQTHTGPRYSRTENSTWKTIYVIEALYEHDISSEFPIKGWNGYTYEEERWNPQSNNQGWNQVMVTISAMPNENIHFRVSSSTNPQKHMKYFVEALPGKTGTLTYGGKQYEQYGETIEPNYGGVTIEDYIAIAGFNKETVIGGNSESARDSLSIRTGSIYYRTASSSSAATWVNFLYTRKTHNIIYYSNSVVVGRDTVPYEANVKSYADNHAEPTNGDDGKYFVGWYQDPDCKVPVGSDLTMPDGDVPLYAKWDTYRVRVVFVPGCTDFWFANNQQLSFRVDLGESIAFDNVKPGVAKRPGYKLVGWYYKDENGVEHELDTDMALPITTTTSGVDMTYQSSADWADNIYGDRDGAHDDVKGILKLYAKWQLDIKEGMVYFLYEVEDGYCVFDTAGNRQTYVPVDGDAHAFDTDVAIMEAPSDYIDGVDFTSWQLLNKNHGVSGIEYLPNHSLRLTESDFSDYIDVISVVDENTGNVYPMKVIRLRAKFTAQSDKATNITFDGNGGTANGQNRYTRVVPLNATVDLETESNSFTRPHHTLIGWNIKADGTGRAFATNEKIFVTNEGGSDSNILYAMWQADIEIAVTGSHKEEIFDNTQKTNGEYTHSFMLGGDPVDYTDNGEITEGGITYHQYTLKGDAAGIKVKIKTTGWPAATGTAKGAYTAADLTDEQLEDMIKIDKSAYTGSLNIKRVYEPATLIIRDLILTITKEVTGGFADMTKQFRFTLTSVQDMTTESFDYWIYRKATGQEYGPYTLNIGGGFELEDGEYIKIEGLPKGKDVIFSEENGEYTTTWTLDAGAATPGDSTTVVLTDDATLAVVNRLEPPSPTGLTFPLAPYALMLAVGVLLLLLRRRRRA